MLQPSIASSPYLRVLTLSIVLLYLTSSHPGNAKIFTRCQLSKELMRYSFNRSTIGSWICIIENESGRSTTKQNVQSNGTTYGLFQINSNTWCRKGRKAGLCNMKCDDLLNEDLSDDVRCAKRVFEKQGFSAWSSWTTRCKGKPIPDISRCP
ncbi:lysozyme [Arctopsyche grandis]|uniref:lysozyme n=1 Tax=Arctopsyche grandis TaxID=121162 RepID=UPI00406D69D8